MPPIISLGKLNHPNPKTFNFPQRQYFCIPFGLISYINANPCSANGLKKLQKTCKYFFSKNKIVVINSPLYYDSTFRTNIFNKSYGCYSIDLPKTKGIKYWPVLKFSIREQGIDLSSIYRCNLKELIIFRQSLKLSEFNFLLNGGRIILLWLSKVNIYDAHENLVTCDQILAKVPKVQYFKYECENEIFTNQTFKKMNTIKLNFKLKTLYLLFYHLSPTIDMLILCKFIRKNMKKKSHIFIEFKGIKLKNHYDVFLAKINEKLFSWLNANLVFMQLVFDNNKKIITQFIDD